MICFYRHSRLAAVLSVAIAASGFITPVGAVMGIGAHKGLDLSVKMGDAVDSYELDGVILEHNGVITDSTAGYSLQRYGFERTPVNFGAKLFIDVIPVIDALEISFNYGVWQYECSFTYPALVSGGVSTETVQVSLDNFNIKPQWDTHGIPFAKLNGDLTIRKYVLRVPKQLKLLNLYAGGGFNFFMSNKILTGESVKTEFEKSLAAGTYRMTDPIDTGKVAGKDVLKEAVLGVTSGMTERQGGIHIMAGATFQVPAVPLAFYADAKLLVPFSELDKQAGLYGLGFLLNAGVAISVADWKSSNADGFE
jgi:hypothetical protein